MDTVYAQTNIFKYCLGKLAASGNCIFYALHSNSPSQAHVAGISLGKPVVGGGGCPAAVCQFKTAGGVFI